MNKTLFALTFVAAAVSACDPFLEDCLPITDAPDRYKGFFYLHGVTSYIQALYMPGLMSAYITSFNLFPDSFWLGASYGIAGVNFALYLPVAAVFTVLAVKPTERMARMFDRWLIAANIYGWVLTSMNLIWFLVLVIMTFVLTFTGEAPSIWVPLSGAIIELILQILYSIGYGKARKLMNCWGWEYPEGYECSWEKRTKDLGKTNDFEDDDDDGALITITFG